MRFPAITALAASFLLAFAGLTALACVAAAVPVPPSPVDRASGFGAAAWRSQTGAGWKRHRCSRLKRVESGPARLSRSGSRPRSCRRRGFGPSSANEQTLFGVQSGESAAAGSGAIPSDVEGLDEVPPSHESAPDVSKGVPEMFEGEPEGSEEDPEEPPESSGEPEQPIAEPGGETGAPFRFFAPSSIWNESPPATAPLDPNSGDMVAALDAMVASEQQAEVGPSINTTVYSVPVYTVPADQPTVQVTLAARYAVPALRGAWSAVPLPANAIPSAGNDQHLVVWQPSTDRLWEFWHLRNDDGPWEADWGGAMQNASSNSGVYDANAWPGATHNWGASASSLSIAGGLITVEDLRRGSIDHALALSVSNVRGNAYTEPAWRTDGKSSEPFALPEGAQLRLDPNLDLQSLHLPHVTLMLAEAAQRYGIFVRDGARNVTFYAQDPVPLGSNPYRGPNGFWEGSYPRRLLSSFPWSSLQVLKMNLHAAR